MSTQKLHRMDPEALFLESNDSAFPNKKENLQRDIGADKGRLSRLESLF